MRTILFLHGWGASPDSFVAIRKYFDNEYCTIAPALPTPPDEVWTLNDYVDYVQMILQRNNITKCDIVAHSFGARVAVLLAKRGMVGKMVITGGAGLRPRFNLWVWLKIKIYKIFKLGKGSTDYKKLNANGKATFNNIIRRDLATEISTLDVPTLLITGERDRATPPYMAKRWARVAGNARYKIYKGCGHFAYLDNPTRFIKDAREFLHE